LREDGGPFPNRLAAGAARAKLGMKQTHDIVPVDGGFALRRKSEGAEAPAPKAATTRPRREPKPLSAAEFADQYRRRLLNEIRRIGGIEQREMPDITGEGRRDKKTGRVHTKAGGWARLLFTKNGHSLDKIVEHMFSLGYFPDFESDNTDIKGYVDEAREIIRAAIDGDSVAALPPAAAQEYAQMAMQEEAQADKFAQEEGLPPKEAPIINSVEDAIAVLGEDRVEQLARQYENEDDAKFLAVLREAVRDQRAHEEDHRGSEVPAQTSHGESGPPEFALEQHTEADLAAREERQRQAQLAEEERNRQEAQRAAADRERQNFALTGSDRPADIAMAGGQIDLLSAPQAPPGAQERQPPESVRLENPFAEKAARARQEFERLIRPTAHDVGMAESFPLGAGFGREGGGKKIDAAIDRAVEAQRALRDAEHYEALAKAFDAGTDEFSRTERAYGGREAYERARAEGRTKLNYRQWVQVRTPAFKRWFGDWETLRAQQRTVVVEDAQKQAPAEAGAATAGHVREPSASAEVDPLLTAVTEFVRQPLRRVNPDTVSKVVDPQTGEPLVVYHGTTSNFDVFDSSWTDASPRRNTAGTGFFFSETPLEAEGYTWSASRVSGSIMPVYLSIKNPYVIGDRYSDAIWGRMLQSKAEAKKARQELVHKGYDGVRTPLGEWVAFHPMQIKSAIGNRGTFSPENPDIRFSRAAGEGQPAVRSTGFDKASGTVVADFKNAIPLKANPDYKAAKAGDTDAAVRLVKALVKPESIEAAKAFGKDVTYVPVHAEEAAGLNKIPNALATYYAEQTGADVDDTLVQTNRAYHTGANAMERLLARAEFSGKVEPGRRYVLVDDVTTMGSTLADLAHYIRSQGGEVAGSVVLVNAMRGGKMTADAKIVRELEARHGDEIRKLFGIEPRALTGPEAQYLIGFRTTDELRNRVAKARQERIDRLHAKGVFPESQDSRGEVSRLLGANAQGQQSARTAPERPYGGLSVSEVQRIADRIAEKWQ